jgi:GNAT superfamily N-acetyltransferase
MKTIHIEHPKGQRPYIQLTVRRVEPIVWNMFKKEHYLSAELNKSCKCLLFEWDGVPVGFVGLINTPRIRMRYAMAISRLVILPDYQGLGLSTIIFNFVGGIVKSLSDEEHEYRLFIKTAHRKFGEALARNPKVRSTANNLKKTSNTDPRYRNRLARKSYCYEYIGEKIEGFEDILLPISVMRSKKMFK